MSLLVDGEKVGELKDIKMAGQYSSVTGYGLLVGRNTGTPVSHEYKAPFAFTGQARKGNHRSCSECTLNIPVYTTDLLGQLRFRS